MTFDPPPGTGEPIEIDTREPALVIAEEYTAPGGFESGEDLSVGALQLRIATLTVNLEYAHAIVRRRRRVAQTTKLAFIEERARVRQNGVDGRNSDERDAKVDYRTHAYRRRSEEAADALRDAADHRDLIDKQITSYQTLLNAAMRAEEIAHAVDRYVAG